MKLVKIFFCLTVALTFACEKNPQFELDDSRTSEKISFECSTIFEISDDSRSSANLDWIRSYSKVSKISYSVRQVQESSHPSKMKWIGAIRRAVAAWNAVPYCKVRFVDVTNSFVKADLNFVLQIDSPYPNQGANPCSGGAWLDDVGYIALQHEEYNGCGGAPFWPLSCDRTATATHEIGHALGLNHPWQGGIQIPQSTPIDPLEIMTTRREDTPCREIKNNDIAAIQTLYPSRYRAQFQIRRASNFDTSSKQAWELYSLKNLESQPFTSSMTISDRKGNTLSFSFSGKKDTVLKRRFYVSMKAAYLDFALKSYNLKGDYRASYSSSLKVPGNSDYVKTFNEVLKRF